MNMPAIRRRALIVAVAALFVPCLVGCSGKDASGETEEQTAQRHAVVKKHKDAVDNGR